MSDPIPVAHIHAHLISGMTRCTCPLGGSPPWFYGRVDQAGANAWLLSFCLLKATSPEILTGGSFSHFVSPEQNAGVQVTIHPLPPGNHGPKLGHFRKADCSVFRKNGFDYSRHLSFPLVVVNKKPIWLTQSDVECWEPWEGNWMSAGGGKYRWELFQYPRKATQGRRDLFGLASLRILSS